MKPPIHQKDDLKKQVIAPDTQILSVNSEEISKEKKKRRKFINQKHYFALVKDLCKNAGKYLTVFGVYREHCY